MAFQLDDAGAARRNNYAAYAELAYDSTDRITLGLAGRFEHYDDSSGDTAIGRANARFASLAGIAALIGDPAQTAMLVALMDGRALTAGELGEAAGVAPPTASGHLGRMLDAGLLALERQGRHRYYRIAGASVAGLIENMMSLSDELGAAAGRCKPIRTGPRDRALRRARLCYDHLAGEVAVAAAASILRDLRDAHPLIELELNTTDDLLDLGGGAADVAVRASRELTGSSLVGRSITADPWSIYCSCDYARAHGLPRTRADLRAHALIGGGGESVWPIYREWLRENDLERTVSVRHSSPTGLLSAVRAGAGLAVLPRMVAGGDPDLIRCLPPAAGHTVSL